MADQAKTKASELRRTAIDKADQGRQRAASALQSTADTLRNRVHAGGDRVSQVANQAASRLESTAEYMREHDVRDMMDDFGGMVRRNPGVSLIAAAAVGFLLGSSMRRDRY